MEYVCAVHTSLMATQKSPFFPKSCFLVRICLQTLQEALAAGDCISVIFVFTVPPLASVPNLADKCLSTISPSCRSMTDVLQKFASLMMLEEITEHGEKLHCS